MSEVIEDCLSNEAEQTTVNRHTNCMLQLALQLVLFKVSVLTQSLAYNVYTVLIIIIIIIIIKYLDRKITSEVGFQQSISCSNTYKYIKNLYIHTTYLHYTTTLKQIIW